MHELSIAYSLVTKAQEIALQEGAKRVTSMTVEIGPLSGVVRESLEFAFPVAIRSTPLEGSKLILEEVPVRIHCYSCGESQDVVVNDFTCPKCNGLDIKLESGHEIRLKSLEVE